MSDSKKLIIGTAFDSKGLDSAIKSLKRLQTEGLKIGKILSGLDLENGGGRGRFAKSIVQTEKHMGKLRGTTQATADTLKNVYGKQMDIEAARLDRTTRQLEKLNKLRKEQTASYQAAARAGASSAELSKRRSTMDRTEGSIVVREGARRVQQENLDELRGAKPPMSGQDKMLIGKAIADAVAGFAGQFQSMKNLGYQNITAATGFQGDAMRQMMGGNFTLSDALTNGRKDFLGYKHKGSGALASAGGKGMAMTQNIGQGASDVFSLGVSAYGLKGAGTSGTSGNMTSAVATANNLGGVAGSAQGVIKAGANGFMGGIEATEAGTLRERAQLLQQMDPKRQMVYEALAQNAGSRLAASRRLGGKHMGMAGMGAGYGLDPFGEALPFATGLADQFGASNVTGKNGLMKHSLQMEQFGLDRSKAGMMLGQVGMANGGTGNARKELEEIFARGIKRGMGPENVQYFEAIGKAVAEHAFGAGGASGNLSAYGQALSYGLDGKSTMHDVQRNISGAGALDSLNTNGYFRAISLENAKKEIGQGGSWAGAQALGDASWSDLSSGNAEMDALGVGGKKQRRAQGKSRIESMLNTFTNGNSAEAVKLRSARDKAGGWQGALGDKSLRGVAAALLHQGLKNSPGGFQSYDDAMGALNFGEGFLEGPESGGHMTKKFGDGNALSQKGTAGRVQMRLSAEEKNVVTKEVFSNAEKFFDKLTQVQPGLNAATDAVAALSSVYDVLAKIAEVAPGAATKMDAMMRGKESIHKSGSKTEGRMNRLMRGKD